MPLDGFLPWKDERLVERMAQDDLRFLYLAGGWLEEDVLITALEGPRGATTYASCQICRPRGAKPNGSRRSTV
ncbi:hypothetical protein CQ14_09415 [Bradyrhizobium lablabi]|uniref:Uncharacterized protein n=1 Tax=Bradyrhizobium lablabi TaxID=722472 RepID=A0A0R3N031_9BRAD|nr:hypothetical protein CQ14_09415 [Bradyrhizobium lablabi]